MTPEQKLQERLKSSKEVSDVFQSFADYNGEKAEEARKKSNIYLLLMVVIVLILMLSIVF